jgi:D-glycero-D-manno-heptose 1,7-bisphosphate phosphatase
MKKKALFLDRDGVINEDVAYVYRPDQIKFIPGIFDLCGKAASKGYCIIVVTNQAGVAKGYFTEEDVVSLHAWMSERFREHGITIAGFYYCPYHKNGIVEKYRIDSDCRKPAPGLFLKAAADFDIDLGCSLMVGDKKSDRIELPGLRCVIVKSCYTTEGFDVESLADVENFL